MAALCQLCSRTIVAIRGRFSWSFACPTCRGIDSALAAPYRARSMIPLEGQDDANRDTVYERLHPALADRTQRATTVVDGTTRVSITDDVPASRVGLDRLRTFQRGLLAAMAATRELQTTIDPAPARPVLSTAGHPMTPASAGRYVRWTSWQEEFRASADASARAYLALVREVHPWIDSVEPRVADLAWLSALSGSDR